jgi:hypothetical protein
MVSTPKFRVKTLNPREYYNNKLFFKANFKNRFEIFGKPTNNFLADFHYVVKRKRAVFKAY